MINQKVWNWITYNCFLCIFYSILGLLQLWRGWKFILPSLFCSWTSLLWSIPRRRLWKLLGCSIRMGKCFNVPLCPICVPLCPILCPIMSYSMSHTMSNKFSPYVPFNVLFNVPVPLCPINVPICPIQCPTMSHSMSHYIPFSVSPCPILCPTMSYSISHYVLFNVKFNVPL